MLGLLRRLNAEQLLPPHEVAVFGAGIDALKRMYAEAKYGSWLTSFHSWGGPMDE